MKKTILLLAALSFTASCASMNKSMLLGGAIGTAIGGGIGNVTSDHNGAGTAIGAVIGAGLGTAMGYMGHKDNERKGKLVPIMIPINKDSKTPTITKPKYRTIWVPEKIEGNRFTEGHRVYILEDAGTWSLE